MDIKLNKNKYNIKVANSFYKRLTGFMMKTNINYGLLFPKWNSIHTYFMKENIDVIGLNENYQVIYKYENLTKNKVININNPRKLTSILELPAGSTKKIKVGSLISFNEE